MGSPIDCGAGDHLGPAISALLVYGVAGVPLLLAVVFALWRTIRHARVAGFYRKLAEPEKATGPVRAIRGKIALDEGVPFALRVEVDQRGKTWKQKRRVYHAWTETKRRSDLRPFRLRTEDGTLVQVDAGPGTLVAAPFVRSTGDTDERAIVAQLENGADVIVVGRHFERGGGRTSSVYRGESAPRVVVRAPASGRLVVSTRPIDRAFRARMHLHLKWLAIALATTVFVHGVLLLGYHSRVLVGQPAIATVAQKRVSRGKSTTYYLTVNDGAGHWSEQSVARSCYEAVGRGDQVRTMLVGDNGSLSQLGPAATANFTLLLISCIAALAVAAIYRRQLRTKGPWYLRKKVDMRGEGPLDVSELPEA